MDGYNKWGVLVLVSCAIVLITVDMTVLYTALPTLTYELDASSSQKLWILNAYTLAVAGLLPGAGTLGDRLGHKKMLVGGLVLFGLASTCAAFSANPPQLIASRVALGVGAAMMMPATLSIIRLSFADAKERAFALGIWGALAAGGSALGPVVGGLLLEYFWWGSVFLVNVPIVVAALAGCFALLPKNSPHPDRPWSLSASLLAVVGLVGLTYAVKEIGKPGGAMLSVFIALAIGLAGVAAFVLTQRRSAHPLIDFALFRDPPFSNGVLVALLATACMIGVELAISQRLQLVMALSPLQAGLAILPLPLASFVGGPLAGLLLHRVGLRNLLSGSLLIAAAGLVLILLAESIGNLMQMAGMAVLGLGAGASMMAASGAIMNRAPANRAGMAASIEEVSYELGGVIGITLFGSLLTAVYAASLMVPPEFADVVAIRDSLDGALIYSENLAPEAARLLTDLARTSFDRAYATVLGLSALMMVGLFAVIRRC